MVVLSLLSDLSPDRTAYWVFPKRASICRPFSLHRYGPRSSNDCYGDSSIRQSFNALSNPHRVSVELIAVKYLKKYIFCLK